ncbi:maleylacetate reductase [uncultured Jatrophihabitans sp.]|uniref:maleylacetate reductase n=1 Tax=uncultured Jatrophihabitans sp. TaxID=1610747 RepID=UPI0035CA16BF
MTAFHYDALPGRVVFGAGCSTRQLEPELQALGARRVLLVVAEQERALADKLIAPLGTRVAATFTDVRQHVPQATVERVLAAARAADADAVLSIGGGSTTGTAKAVALRTSLPIVAVPTTYAGSEMTPIWGMTAGGRKTTGRDLAVLPKTVLYDPDLTLSLPSSITVSSAFNAIAHCVEALYGPGANPITSLVAVEGIRALAAGLVPVVTDLHDSAARSDLLYGAYLAGTAFAAAGSGLHHTICHVLGGAFDLPHAPTHAVVLPHVAAFNEPAVPDMRRAARALGSDSMADGLAALAAATDAPTSLRELGMPQDGVEEAVRVIMQKDLSGNPRPLTEGDVRAILGAALAGRPAAVEAYATAAPTR